MTTDQEFILRHSCIPDRYIRKGLKDLAPEMAVWRDRARLYVRSFCQRKTNTSNPGLYIVSSGDVGVGKTHLACSILRGLVLTGKAKGQVTFYSFGALALALVADAMDRLTDQQAEMLHRLETSRVVVLDDIDKFSGTAQAVYRIHRIIDDLWCRNIPIIVTANLLPSQLSDRFEKLGADAIVADAIVSRLVGMTELWLLDGQKDKR